MISKKEVFKLVSEHHDYVRSTLNLMGSENISSPMVKLALASDLVQRYTTHECYKFYDRLEQRLEESFARLLGADFANVKPISGTVANLIGFLTLTKRDKGILAPSLSCGGHKSYTNFGIAGIIGLRSTPLPFDEKEWIIDIEGSRRVIDSVQPSLVIVGGMTFLFPQPVRQISDIAGENDARVLYDGAQVFGLILGKNFQNPIDEHVDILTASTHKTFPGPQGGIIAGKGQYSNRTKELIRCVLANEHPFRIPSLALALLEMSHFGEKYASMTVQNARALAQALHENGFSVLCEHKGFTRTHQIVVDVSNLKDGYGVSSSLEKAGIVCKKVLIPKDEPSRDTCSFVYPPKKMSGLRLGVAEITRLGMKTTDMIEIADLMKQLLYRRKSPEQIRKKVIELKRRFVKIHFSFDKDGEAYYYGLRSF